MAFCITEVVVFESSQCLPRYLVELQPSLPNMHYFASGNDQTTKNQVIIDQSFPNTTTDIKQLTALAEKGNNHAQALLGRLYLWTKEEPQTAAKWLQMAINSSNPLPKLWAQGTSYAEGVNYKKESSNAFNYFKTAADQGYAPAQSNLGVCYSNGDGVAKDKREAVKWYRMAADQGYADAQYNLGNCYLNGEGVAKDEEEAVKWLQMAADQGYADALNVLDKYRCSNQ